MAVAMELLFEPRVVAMVKQGVCLMWCISSCCSLAVTVGLPHTCTHIHTCIVQYTSRFFLGGGSAPAETYIAP